VRVLRYYLVAQDWRGRGAFGSQETQGKGDHRDYAAAAEKEGEHLVYISVLDPPLMAPETVLPLLQCMVLMIELVIFP
jgi:hypothetical protein